MLGKSVCIFNIYILFIDWYLINIWYLLANCSRAVLSNRNFLWWWEHSISILSSVLAISYIWLESTWIVTSVTKEMNCWCYLFLINFNLNLNSHMSLVATVLNSTGLEDLNQVTFPLVIYMSVLCVLVNISIFFFHKILAIR